MCMAILHKPGAALPKKKILRRCWARNPHGAGYFWRTADGNYRIRKGFMDWDEFIFNYEAEGFTKKMLFGIHFRWATSGGRSPAQTHPFPVSNDQYDLKDLEFKADAVMMHNGILGNGKGVLSDTMLFALEIARRAKKRPIKDFKNWIAEKTAGSRVVIIQGRTLLIFGDWIEESPGLFFSNDRYKHPLKSLKRIIINDDLYDWKTPVSGTWSNSTNWTAMRDLWSGRTN